jgi:CheY-like chemotaxis protein
MKEMSELLVQENADRRTPPSVVLVVDDEPLIRLVAAETLRDEGFTVYEAADAAEALDVMAHHAEVDLVFTDIDMPGMSGLELALEIRRRRPDVRCLLTSGRPRPRGAPRGANFLPKPYSLGGLGAEVRRSAA